MRDITQIVDFAAARARGSFYSLLGSTSFNLVGRNLRYYGVSRMSGSGLRLGDNCWFEAVEEYQHHTFKPHIFLGTDTRFGNNVHISGVRHIQIGRNCLFGSNIYIGDHSHGTTKPNKIELDTPPAFRPLDDAADIIIGDNVWVSDGVVILAGSVLGAGAIVGANSVVRGSFPRSTLVAGVPARMIREL